MWYFRIIIFLLSFSAIGQNYYYVAGKTIEAYVPPSPTLLPDSYGVAAYPDSENVITNGWITGRVILETGTTRHGSTALKYTPDETPHANDSERTTNFIPSGYAIGKSYRFSGWSYHLDGTSHRASLYDPTAGFSEVYLSTSAGWTYFEVDFTAGQANNFRIYIRGDGNFLVDDMELIELP